MIGIIYRLVNSNTLYKQQNLVGRMACSIWTSLIVGRCVFSVAQVDGEYRDLTGLPGFPSLQLQCLIDKTWARKDIPNCVERYCSSPSSKEGE